MKFIVLFFYMLVFSFVSKAQSTVSPQKSFDQLNVAYRSGKLHDTIYLQKTDSLVGHFLNQGIMFESNELAKLLDVYQDIAWGKKRYDDYRVDYYMYLLNNARMFDKRGASIYYAEKVNKELRNSNKDETWVELAQKLYIYSGQLNYEKILSGYKSAKPKFAILPERLKKRQVRYRDGLNSLYVLSPAIMAAASIKDTAEVYEIEAFADGIIDELRKMEGQTRQDMMLLEFHKFEFDYALANYEENYIEAEKILFRVEDLKETFSDIQTGILDFNLIQWRLELYIHLKNIEKSEYYLQRFESIPEFGETQKGTILRFKARIEDLKGNNLQSKLYLEEALKENDKVNGYLIAEMDAMLYAQTESEDSLLSLQKSEQAKKARTIWIVVISVSAITVILLILFLMKKRDFRSKKIITALNNSADIQLSLMAEARDQARRDEQHRISQDLHDDLAGKIASIKNRLEIETNPERHNANLESLKKLTQQVYDQVRNQSHQLFDTSAVLDENRFRQHILDMAETAFPKDQYQYQVVIDDGALNNTNFELRSHLIRILQESFTNVLHHARADKVDVLIYHEEDGLILEIQDNGQENKKIMLKKGIGLKNMAERTRKMGGTFTIESTNDGTLLRFLFPFDS
ncbi:sensor histidine kinase [Sphingobacterium hungaricum]